MKNKINKILESRGIDSSRQYSYSLLYQVKPELNSDIILGLLVENGAITPQTKVYQRGADENDFDVIRIYVVGINPFELTKEEFEDAVSGV